MYYLILYFIILICYFISKATNISPKNKKITYWFLFVCMWFTAGLRYETGTDYFTYLQIYNGTNTILEFIQKGEISSNFGNIEFGYLFISSIFRTFRLDMNVMFFVISFVTNILLFKSAEKYVPQYKFLIILTYYSFVFFILDMSGVRQAIACSIILFALRYIYDHNALKYFLLVSLSISFHYSAIIALPLYFFLNKKISSFVIYLITLIGFIVIAFKIPIVEILIRNFIAKIIPESTIAYKLLIYSEDGIMMSWGLNAKIILNILILLFMVKKRNLLSEKIPYFNIILNLFFIYVFIRGLLWESVDINSRLNYYFIPGLFLGLPILLSSFKFYLNKLTVLVFIIIFNFYQSSAWLLESPSTLSYNPYQNYFIYKSLNYTSDGLERNYMQSKIKVSH